MAVELNLSRNETNVPWGFRLTGGADQQLPLTVIKVEEGSIADIAGMKIGDLVVRVGDTSTSGLSHIQAHDLILASGNNFPVAVIRGELPILYAETEECVSTETSHEGLSQTLQFNITTNVVGTTEIMVETGEVVEQNIKINGEVVSNREDVNIKTTEAYQSVETDIETEKTLTTENINVESFGSSMEQIKQSEVLKVLKEDATETKQQLSQDKKWTTFLQKPTRPKPKLKQKEDDIEKSNYEEHVLLTRVMCLVQEPPYRVIIQKHKKRMDSEKSMSSQSSTPIPEEIMNVTPEPSPNIEEQQRIEEQENCNEHELEREEIFEQMEEYLEQEEQVINEVELSLEDQLGAIQKQLLALSQLPAAIQQTLDAVTQQLTKIVGPVNEPQTEDNEIVEETAENEEGEETYTAEEHIAGDLETLEEVSESGYEKNSQQGDDEEQQPEQEAENPETEMLQVTPEPEEDLTPEEREARKLEQAKVDKKDKINHWNDIWPWGDHLGRRIYRDANTHMVPSKAIDSKKINFLKYTPPPKTLDHLKNSEVFRLVHDMDTPTRGVCARQGKAMAEEDYYAQIHKTEDQSQQMKG